MGTFSVVAIPAHAGTQSRAAPAAARHLRPHSSGAIRDPARLDWNEATKVAHYYLSVDAMTRPMQVRETSEPYGESEP